VSTEGSRRGVSKAQWLEAGLEALSQGGVSSVTVEGLARSLGIARSGFYWHFEDRRDLLRQLLAYWSQELTAVVTENAEVRALDPRSRLTRTAEMILDYDLARYDVAIRQWALHDAEAARVVRAANRMRLRFVRGALSELGFEGDDLEMRTMFFVCYQTWESATFREIPRKRRRQLIARRVELLTRGGG
jgi:AcrR family transcriptional regulator